MGLLRYVKRLFWWGIISREAYVPLSIPNCCETVPAPPPPFPIIRNIDFHCKKLGLRIRNRYKLVLHPVCINPHSSFPVGP